MPKQIVITALLLGAVPALAGTAPPGAESCSGCHGPHASAGPDKVPSLAGRQADEIVASMLAFRTGGREPTVMDRIAKGFSEDEIRAIAAWIAGQR